MKIYGTAFKQGFVCVNSEISHDALLSQLHNLDHHSALYVLHSLTPLARYEEHRVLELLQATGNTYTHTHT